MKTNRGKGYFYAMGQRDRVMYGLGAIHYLLGAKKGRLPDWAVLAYKSGYNGWGQ